MMRQNSIRSWSLWLAGLTFSACQPGAGPTETLNPPSRPGEQPNGLPPEELPEEPTAIEAGLNVSALAQALNCPQLAMDRNLCLVSEYPGQLTLFGLESSATCPLDAYAPSFGSLGWIGDRIYSCDIGANEMSEVSLVDGSVRQVALNDLCLGVTAWGPKLVTMGAGTIEVYRSFADIPNNPRRVYNTSQQATRLTTDQQKLFGAWHSTDEIVVFDLIHGQDLTPISIAPYDDWVYGLGMTRAGELAMFVPERNGDMQIRDSNTGAILRTVPTQGLFSPFVEGMTCGGARFRMAPPPPPPPDPVQLSATCGGAPSSFDTGSQTSPQLHAIGIYEPVNGTVDVLIDRPGDVELVLVAYSQTTWNVSAAAGTNLLSVRVDAHEAQTVNAPAGVAVTIEVYETGGSPTLSYAYDWRSFEARKLRFDIESQTGTPMRSFNGCYAGESFTVH